MISAPATLGPLLPWTSLTTKPSPPSEFEAGLQSRREWQNFVTCSPLVPTIKLRGAQFKTLEFVSTREGGSGEDWFVERESTRSDLLGPIGRSRIARSGVSIGP